MQEDPGDLRFRTSLRESAAGISQQLGAFAKDIQNNIDILGSEVAVKVLEDWKIFDTIISQKRTKNISVRILGPPLSDEKLKVAIKRMIPFSHYKSIASSSVPPKTVILIKDDAEIFAIEFSESIGVINNFMHSKESMIVRVTRSAFVGLWQQTEYLEKLQEEKKHSDLLLDVLTHDLGNHNQIIVGNLDLASAAVENMLKKISDSASNDSSAALSSLLKGDAKEIKESINAADQTVKRSISIVDNVRMIERMHRVKGGLLFPCSVVDSINRAAAIVQKVFDTKKEIKLNITKPAGLVRVEADGLLEEIFVNLFSNSAKHTASRQVRIDINISENMLGDKKYWMISVSDYGSGILDSVKDELFQRFYLRTRGSGLGLAIVKALVERYRGKVWVADRVYKDHSKGASFGMILPSPD